MNRVFEVNIAELTARMIYSGDAELCRSAKTVAVCGIAKYFPAGVDSVLSELASIASVYTRKQIIKGKPLRPRFGGTI